MLWALVFAVIALSKAAIPLNTTDVLFNHTLRASYIAGGLGPPKPSFWGDYRAQGYRLYKTWEQKSGPDDTSGPWISSTGNPPTIERGWVFTPDLPQMLETVPLSTDPSKYLTVSLSAKHYQPGQRGRHSFSSFNTSINPNQGTLISNRAVMGKTNVNPAVILRDALWESWIAALEHNGRPETECEMDKSGSSSIWKLSITDYKTLALIKYITRKDSRVLHYYSATATAEADNPFWPLLSTPVGEAAIRLLTAHKSELVGKAIKTIGIAKGELEGKQSSLNKRFVYHMWIQLERPPPGDGFFKV